MMIRVRTALALPLALAATLSMTGCTSNGDETSTSASPTASPSAQASPTQKQLSAQERAQQLNALAPSTFDAAYRLTSKGPRPDAAVRMRAKGARFRLDITHGRRTAVLVYAPRGVVSCQVVSPKDKKSHRQRSCFLVSRKPARLPDLFDPEVQRLFRSTQRALTLKRSDVKVARAGTGRAPHGLGPTECFMLKGHDVDSGRYCYLSKPGPAIGLLARAGFPSGTLEIRDVKQIRRDDAFRPPVRPTPLSNG